ncbi:MAG TPA: DinB family protein [Vicinamibacterales bacterium]|nr:DinB family protein [Vicinamibacterales bacterium]
MRTIHSLRPSRQCTLVEVDLEFAGHWRKVRSRTVRLLELVPPDNVEWSPAAGVMTIGDVFRHLAVTERWLFVEVARGGVSTYRTHGPQLGRTREEIAILLRQCHDESLRIIANFTPADWQRHVTTPAGASLPAWKWLRAMVEHEAHHRGQLYLMLRLAGIPTPPIFGLTAEDVMSRSSR